MNSFSYKVIGLFLLSSGFIYSLERISSLISTSIIKAGFFSGQMTGEVPQVTTANFLDNLFVPLLFFISLVLLILGFKKVK
ncbi:hypothetical protein F7731_22345 [Cytobacillus depressus]|uniref:Uncharacterized protein n=1 Tax=Cytobacillus depressus TaxID=1602942 RepID=A0A6L3UZ52_9BACI|nr:hypothetical protein [Cytobacillus depressus]KAB2329584.1 hypothetical protein F7731_22345 [Cytobacillus depressus]